VPTSITLKILHDVVQAAMGWFEQHLWEFRMGSRRFDLPMDEDWGTEPRMEAAKVRLREVLTPRRTVISYVYDFGDEWEHRLILTNIRQGEPGIGYPQYVAGECKAAPEDCGGIPGFYDKLDAGRRATPSSHHGGGGLDRRRTTRTRSTNSRSGSPSAGSQIAGMPPKPGSKSPPPDHRISVVGSWLPSLRVARIAGVAP
jgi:hypothetical protein